MHFTPRLEMDVSGELHAPVALLPRKRFTDIHLSGDGLTQQKVWAWWQTVKSCSCNG